MLRPERMSKVSVTGTKAVMQTVIETVHDLNLLHLTDYDGSWEGFDPGDPIEGAEEASERLVTVRSIESILDIDDEDAGPARIVTDEDIEEELEGIRTEVNELDDRRGELRDELREIEERIDAAEPFVDLGIDLDLLSGYGAIEVRVGEGSAGAVEDALSGADGVGAFETFASGGTVAVFADADPGDLDDALVGVEFTAIEIPDAEGDPESYVEELEHERQRVESRLRTVEDELEELKLDAAGFLLAAEERLSIDVQKSEAPLQFATTENAFVAEGWIPTERYGDLAGALRDAVGDHVEIEELERAEYDPPGHGHAATDGGTVDNPPVVQDNPGPVKPFELLVETINRPRYWEIDPTVVLFLTFPVFFGFMIGDLGYGLLYVALGYWLTTRFDSDAIESLGGIAMWAGGFTALFGILYGEVFGLHAVAHYLWEGALGMKHAPIEKGLQNVEFARLWLALSLVVGLIHLGVGWLFGFFNDLQGHGLKDAVLENLSALALMSGVFVWIFSGHLQGQDGPRPEFIFDVIGGQPLPPTVGVAGLGLAVVGLVLLIAGEGVVGLLESPTYALVNVLSYTRIAAVLLAKAGMAFVVNLLVFGGYTHGGEVHFLTWYAHVPHEAHLVPFEAGGLLGMGIVGALAGLVVLVLGHALVLALGVTSAGLQGVRLEYVEFFGKFYEGGGEEYDPFGYDRNYTASE